MTAPMTPERLAEIEDHIPHMEAGSAIAQELISALRAERLDRAYLEKAEAAMLGGDYFGAHQYIRAALVPQPEGPT